VNNLGNQDTLGYLSIQRNSEKSGKWMKHAHISGWLTGIMLEWTVSLKNFSFPVGTFHAINNVAFTPFACFHFQAQNLSRRWHLKSWNLQKYCHDEHFYDSVRAVRNRWNVLDIFRTRFVYRNFAFPCASFKPNVFFMSCMANNLTIYSCETNLLFLNSGVDKTSGSAIKHILERPLVDKKPISIRIISQYNISKNAEQLSYFVIKWGKGVSSGF
jgi:hypothetical protein